MCIENSCFFTGHRHIPEDDEPYIREKLCEKIEILIKKGVTNFISGGAYGFDTICAEEVLNMKKRYPHIRLYLFLPCVNHNLRWNKESREHFDKIMHQADSVITTSEFSYFNGCTILRNTTMVKSALYCIAYYQGRGNGTKQTINCAKEHNRIIVNIG